MKTLRAAQTALLVTALGEVSSNEDASHCFPEGAGADPGLSCPFWPGQPSWQAGMSQERLRIRTAPAQCQPQPPVLLCPPGLWLAQHLAHPSLCSTSSSRAKPQYATSGGSSLLLFRTNGS